ncbi:MAG TPA: chromate efflux transporter [Candidatus Limnocylindrales bacterium]|nr:chromate efflux transporter [Candidatus Limnocylindrales bacterium]
MEPATRLRDLLVVFGTLGIVGFGGPAAHIALMRREVVERRQWLNDAQLLDLVGITNLIPGPNSTELAMLVGRMRAGGMGLVVAGLSFIIPAAGVVLALAWAYMTYGTTPTGAALLYGIKPVIIAIVAAALVAFARTSLTGPLRVGLAAAVAMLWVLGVNELVLLAAGALIVAAARGGTRYPWVALGIVLPATAAASVNLLTLAGVFLKAGALLYGSGYVLLAFLRGDLVQRLGWLTDAQLLDAVAIGQVTPGPLFTTATFIGYVLAGVPGAVVATIAIFLPAFIFVALIGPIADRLRRRPLTAALLDGVNAAAIGLMAAVSVALGAEAIHDPLTIVLALGAGAALIWARVPSVVLVAVGGLAGVAAGAAGIGP